MEVWQIFLSVIIGALSILAAGVAVGRSMEGIKGEIARLGEKLDLSQDRCHERHEELDCVRKEDWDVQKDINKDLLAWRSKHELDHAQRGEP